MELTEKEINNIWKSLPDNFKEKVFELYNDAASINNEPGMSMLSELFGDNILKMFKEKYTFVTGDIVRYKRSLKDLCDMNDIFTVEYFEEDAEYVRCENVYTGTRKTININNLELVP